MTDELTPDEKTLIWATTASRLEWEKYALEHGLAEMPDVGEVEKEARALAKRGGATSDEALMKLYRARRGLPTIPRQPRIGELSPRLQQAATAQGYRKAADAERESWNPTPPAQTPRPAPSLRRGADGSFTPAVDSNQSEPNYSAPGTPGAQASYAQARDAALKLGDQDQRWAALMAAKRQYGR